MKFIKDNFWQMLVAGAILLWVGWVSLGVNNSVSKERFDKTTDQFTRLVELMVTANKEMATKADLREIREDMRAGFERIDRRLEALEKRLDQKDGRSNNPRK